MEQEESAFLGSLHPQQQQPQLQYGATTLSMADMKILSNENTPIVPDTPDATAASVTIMPGEQGYSWMAHK